jgi:glucose dehydrogenase
LIWIEANMAGVSAKSERQTDPNRHARLILFPFLVSVLAWIPLESYGQYHAKETEWPTYAADLAGTRYRPFDQINASNFNDLEVAWRLKTDMFGNRPEYKLEGTPLMVNGVLYTTAGSRRAAIAVDAATGELLWVHGEREGKRGAA